MLTHTENNVEKDRQWSLLPVELFRTQEGYYVFDFNRVNVFEVTEIISKTLSAIKQKSLDLPQLSACLPEYSQDDLREALGDIAEIQEQGFLTPNEFQRKNPFSMDNVREYLNGHLQGLYLNITSQCNLSCSYCIFGGKYKNVDNLDNRRMSRETADKAMEFFKARASKEGTLRIDFFGGEPMMEFKLIEYVVSQMKPWVESRGQDLKVSISSNGTIMNEKIADFLIENKVYFQISMDGEKEIHDANRKYKNKGTGSFDTIMKVLQYIHDRDIEYFKSHMRLKAVLTTESLKSGKTDFEGIDFIRTMNENQHFSVLNQTPHWDVKKDDDYFDRLHLVGKMLLEKRDVSTIDELLDGLDYKKKLFFHSTFVDFFTVQVHHSMTFGVDEAVPFRKNCLIGAEGCVNVEGDISICYKANSFKIGSVLENRWYFDKIEEYHKARYSRNQQCKSCFLQRFCSLCYEKLSAKGDCFGESFGKYCEFSREYYRVVFQYMLQVIENNPGLWDELQRMAEVESAKRRGIARASGDGTGEALERIFQ